VTEIGFAYLSVAVRQRLPVIGEFPEYTELTVNDVICAEATGVITKTVGAEATEIARRRLRKNRMIAVSGDTSVF
jgi:hypothetical protein